MMGNAALLYRGAVYREGILYVIMVIHFNYTSSSTTSVFCVCTSFFSAIRDLHV